MMLTRCSHCRRFVRGADDACPFCHERVVHARSGALPRVSRAAALALATTAAACSSTTNVPAYGAPGYGAVPYDAAAPSDAGSEAEAGADAAKDAPSE